MPKYISVEEAARRAGKAPATIRRWCGQGRITAVKQGRDWLVDPGSLPEAVLRTVRQGIVTPHLDLHKSLAQLLSRDLLELWVPDVLGYADRLAESDSLVADTARRLDNLGPFDPLVEVEVPKRPFFSRSAHLLSLEDRLGLHALTASFAARVEQALTRIERNQRPSVFSARSSSDPRFLLRKGTDQWVEWKQDIERSVEAGFVWGVKSDVTAYFANISHELLLADVQSLNVDPNVLLALEAMLDHWSLIGGRGIPEGPDASRVLGNLFLLPVDEAMQELPVRYSRYMDDFRILARTRGEAVRGIRLLERECRKRGLILANHKTKLLRGEDIVNDFEDSNLTAAQYWLQVGNLPLAKKILISTLKEGLLEEEDLDIRKARFSLWRLRQMPDEEVTSIALGRLGSFAPVANLFATFLRPRFHEERVLPSVAAFLTDPEQNTSPYLSTWLLAAALDAKVAHLNDDLIEYSRNVARDRNQPNYHRVVAANVMGTASTSFDLAWLRAQTKSEYDPVVLRGYLVALRRGDAFDPALGRGLARNFPELRQTVRYLTSTETLPDVLTDRPVDLENRTPLVN